MAKIGPLVLVVGVISMVLGLFLRLLARQTALGLTPSSFLEFSVACFLLTIALKIQK